MTPQPHPDPSPHQWSDDDNSAWPWNLDGVAPATSTETWSPGRAQWEAHPVLGEEGWEPGTGPDARLGEPRRRPPGRTRLLIAGAVAALTLAALIQTVRSPRAESPGGANPAPALAAGAPLTAQQGAEPPSGDPATVDPGAVDPATSSPQPTDTSSPPPEAAPASGPGSGGGGDPGTIAPPPAPNPAAGPAPGAATAPSQKGFAAAPLPAKPVTVPHPASRPAPAPVRPPSPTSHPTPTPSPTPTPVTAPPPAPAWRYDFEDGGTDGWTVGWGGAYFTLTNTAARAFSGSHSLAMMMNGGNGYAAVKVLASATPGAGQVVTYHVYSDIAVAIVPTVWDAGLTAHSLNPIPISAGWNTVRWTVPSENGYRGVGLQVNPPGQGVRFLVALDAVQW